MSWLQLSTPGPYDAPGLLFAGFNQDHGCLAVGTDDGFRVFNCEPFKEKVRRVFQEGGIAFVEMLFRCNYLALVGGGRNPLYPPNKVVIWDDVQACPVIELEFKVPVKAVRLRKDKIVIVTVNRVYVFSFTHSPQRLNVFETFDNERGVCALCSSSTNAFVAFPGQQRGHIQLADLSDAKRSPLLIVAHAGTLACLAISKDGTKVASASEKGTLIRVFDTETGKLLNELRRGSERAEIHSIAMNAEGSLLCVSSDRGTVHIFNLESASQNASSGSQRDSLPANRHLAPSFSVFRPLLPKYFSSEWSFAHYQLPDDCSRSAVGFAPDGVLVVTSSGGLHRVGFDTKGRSMTARGEDFFRLLD